MPFLLPALTALVCDSLVLFLRPSSNEQIITDGEGKEPWVYNISYLPPLALIRLLLLLLPLLFYSYTGRALHHAKLYHLFYWSTLVVITLHMLALALLDPTSLTALMPATRRLLVEEVLQYHRILLQHLHQLRRIWALLGLSWISNVCHLMLLYHVKSTAPTTLPLDKKKPSVYFALRSSQTLHINSHSPPLVHAMNDFVVDLQGRFQRAKTEWDTRLQDFGTRMTHDRPTPFRVLLLLFAYEDVLQNGKLDAVFELDDGRDMTFFVPQLLSFLLHGALWCSPQLEEWILQKCSVNVYFAHRCYWFLRAWCLETGEPVQSISMSSSRDDNSNHGLVPFLDEPASPQAVTSDCRGRLTSLSRIPSRRLSNDKFLPEERAMIERLMLRVKECGEGPARILELGDDGDVLHRGNDTNGSDRQVEFQGEKDHSPSTLMQAVESGAIPIDPTTGYPSVKHMDSVAARRKFGFLPLDRDESRLSSSELPHASETENFDKTPRFLDALVFLADRLFQVPRPDRKEELRKQLRALECELLPSNAIYVPIGNVHHRVWRIVPEESIAIGTKERVPCIVYLEVVDYSPKRKKPRAWSIMPRRTVQRSASGEGEMLSSETGHLERELTESELVDQWRRAPRDPLRRVTLFDKMATTVRDKMKGPLDKMKTQVRDKFNQMRDHTVNEEHQALMLDESLVNGDDGDDDAPELAKIASEPSDDDDGDDAPDLENGLEDPLSNPSDVSPRRSLSRISSANSFASMGSLVSMGQWSTPVPSIRGSSLEGNGRGRPSGSSLRKKLERDSSEESGTGTLTYGSDHEEDRSESQSSPLESGLSEREPIDLSERGPTGEDTSTKGTKKPCVVFRESWQTKQERIRKTSAYGSHRGWRLLPVLIKANDDLRQEQLASQLIYRMASILAREKVAVWLCPYEIIALTERGGILEAIPDTISLDSLKKGKHFTSLRDFFNSHFGEGTEELADAEANFIESLAAYSIVCFLLQIKDRHNGNILLDSRGHVIHIDFGFFFLSSPGKNAGFESAPFKLTRDFVELMGGPESHMFRTFRELCVRTFITLRKHCHEIILLVEMIKPGNEELQCFRGRPDDAIREFRERFRLDLNDRACKEYVNSLVDMSIENWRTDWYDRYQRYFVGVL